MAYAGLLTVLHAAFFVLVAAAALLLLPALASGMGQGKGIHNSKYSSELDDRHQ
jgi:hypothetical protein